MTHAMPSDDGAPGAPGFAAHLRDRTALVHREAERAGFIADLIRGRASRSGYAIYLRNLAPIYAALEVALAGSVDGGPIAAFADPRLRRLPSLVSDLDAVHGADWDAALPCLPEAEAYAESITRAATDDRLIAHAYARYLGDLSGGQILKPILARSLGLGPESLAVYDFVEIVDLGAAKRAMREALDRVDPARAESVVAEAITAFRHTIAVSEAVRAAAA